MKRPGRFFRDSMDKNFLLFAKVKNVTNMKIGDKVRFLSEVGGGHCERNFRVRTLHWWKVKTDLKFRC